MHVPDTVTFGIPLVGRSVAMNWARVVHQLNATIGSIYNQTDPNFRIIIGGSDHPELSVPTDERLVFLAIDQMAPMTDAVFQDDSIRKRHRIAQRLKALGGGYLMHADADDLISRELVAFVRRDRHRNGYLVGRGYMFDATRGVIAPFPFIDDGHTRFDQECGTSAVLALTADELPADDRDRGCRYSQLMSKGHPSVIERAVAEGRPLVDLPFRAVVYVRHTGENVSARHAFSTLLPRILFQAELDDGLDRARLERTPELDAEFNLTAAATTLRDAAAVRPSAALGLSILVATHGRPAGLRRLLAALRPQVAGRNDRQVVVVNDGTHDDAYAAVVAEFADMVEYHAFAENRGIVAARNAALATCRGEYAVFTDDDCLPPPWWLDWLAARLLHHPEIDVVAGAVHPRWSRRTFRERLEAAWFLPQPWSLAGRVIFVTANAAVRTSLLRSVGGFGFAGFASTAEDTELCIRLHRAGARFLTDPSWRVAHDVGAPMRSIARRFARYGDGNRRVAAAASIQIPPPSGIETGLPLARQTLALFRYYHREHRPRFEGSFVGRVGAALAATAIQMAYLRGLSGRSRLSTAPPRSHASAERIAAAATSVPSDSRRPAIS